MSTLVLSDCTSTLPRIVTPAITGCSSDEGTLTSWIISNRKRVLEELLVHGALLFRDHAVGGPRTFETIALALCDSLDSYIGGNSPRTRVSGNVFTTTEYPQSEAISLHNEASYRAAMPRRILFYCLVAPAAGGQTPLADSRAIYAGIDPLILERFEHLGVKYVNNLHSGKGIGKSWQDVFQTSDRKRVEQFLTTQGYEYEWGAEGTLRTSIVCPAVRTHPDTGQTVWVNQAEQWHPSSLRPEIREALNGSMAPEDFPHQAYFGDGTPLVVSDLDHIRMVMREQQKIFQWQADDLLICDNYLVMHGRQPYDGPRKIICALG